MNEGVSNPGIYCLIVGVVFLAVVVVAVLSYRYFAGPAEGPSGSGGAPRPSASRGRQVTPAMVEVFSSL